MSKKSDVDIFQGMVSQTKKQSGKKLENVGSLINRIIHLIRNKDRPLSLIELQKELKDSDLKNKKFLSELIKSEKIRYDEKTEMLSLKSKYGISNLEELKAKIRQSELGLPEDDELKDVYPGVKADLEKLKNENYVRVIENDDKSNVLFFRDTSEKFDQKLIDNTYKPAIELLRKIWKDEIKFFDNGEKSAISFIRKKRTPEEMEAKSMKRRRITKWANEHIFSDIFNSSSKK